MRIIPILFLAAAPACAQLWTGVLDPSRAIDWSGAGVVGGIPTRTTVCSTLTSAATTTTINATIAACPANQVVVLGAGTYTISAGLRMGTSGVVLRGAGPLSTIVNFTGPDSCGGISADICAIGPNPTYDGAAAVQPGGSNAATWSAGYSQGATSITLTSVGSNAPVVGQMIMLDQDNETAPANGIMQCDSIAGGCSGNDGSSGRIISGVKRSQIQVVKITAISGSTYTITPGLYANNWRSGKNPGAWWSGAGINNVGIENMTLDHSASSQTDGIQFYDCLNCWVKNVRSINGNRSHVHPVQSAHVEVRDSYFYGTQNGAEQSYGLEPEESCDIKGENNIGDSLPGNLVVIQTCGLVFSYNESRNGVFSNPAWLIDGTLSHGSGSHMNLLEGNHNAQIASDNQHGSSPLATIFRNRVDGQQPPTGQKASNTFAFDFQSYERGLNIVGNVLGTAGYHTKYESSPNTSTTNCNLSIYSLGWGYSTCGAGGTPPPANDTDMLTNLMRWGNYDTVNASVQWNSAEVPTASGNFFGGTPVPSSHTLASSWYLSARPSWWALICSGCTTPPWPAIGPDVTGGDGPGGFSYKNPAQQCADHTAFDAAYSTTSTVTAASWSGGQATVTIGSAAANVLPNTPITVSGVTPSGYNCTACYVLSQTGTTVTYVLASNPGSYTSGGSSKWPLVLAYDATACYASPSPSTTVSVVGNPTPTRAVLLVKTAQSTCTIKVSPDPGFATLAADTDATLFAGSNQCNRSGSIDNGATKLVVVGERKATLALTGKMISRALQCNTKYYYEVTAGTDVVSGSFTTANPPYSTAPDVLPYDSNGYGGYAYPTLDWTDTGASTAFVDPLTGIPMMRATKLGYSGGNSQWGIASPFGVTDIDSAWTTPANVTTTSTSYASIGAASHILYVKPDSRQVNFTQNANFGGYNTVDDVDLVLSGCGDNATAANRTLSVGLYHHRVLVGVLLDFILPQGTISGGNCTGGTAGSPTFSITRTYPSPLFADWQAGALRNQDTARFTAAWPSTGHVNTSGTAVAWVDGNTFNLDWVSGDKITIGASEFTISSVTSGQALILTASAGTNTGATYAAGQFEIGIAKKNSTGTVAINSAAINYGYSPVFFMTADGDNDFCSSVPFPGVVHRSFLCMFPQLSNTLGLYLFDTVTGQSVHVSNMLVPGGYTPAFSGDPKDTYTRAQATGVPMFDRSAGDTVYMAALTGAGGMYRVIVKGVLGSPNEWPTTPALRYNENTENPAMTWTNLTPASLGQEVMAGIHGANALFDYNSSTGATFFSPVSVVGMNGDSVVVSAGAQNLLGFVAFFNVNTHAWIAKESFGAYPSGGQGLHAVESTGPVGHVHIGVDPTTQQGVQYKMIATGLGSDGAGAVATGFVEACPGGLDARWVALGATGNHCVRLQVDHQFPYNDAAGAAEIAHWPCGFSGSASCPSPVVEGMNFGDGNKPTAGNEKLLLVKIQGSTLWFLRNAFGCDGNPNNMLGSAPVDDHAAGWSMVWWPPSACFGSGIWISTTDGSITLDNPWINGIHMDFCSDGQLDSGTMTANAGMFVRSGTIAAQTLVDPWDFTYDSFFSFAGSTAGSRVVQAHPSCRQHNSSERLQWVLDGNPFSGGTGGNPTLWTNTATLMPGFTSVYKLTLPTSLDRKRLPLATWAGGNNLRDISGVGSAITDGSTSSICVADLVATECIAGRASPVIGEVFVNVPQPSTGGTCLQTLATNTPCVVTAIPFAGWQSQYRVDDLRNPIGRRLSTSGPPGSHNTYTNIRSDPDGKWFFTVCSWCQGMRSELMVGLLPPQPPLDSINRSTFIPIPVSIGGVTGDTIRIAFGYGEYGTSSQFYCTTRQEACYTDSTGAAPFVWASETQHYAACGSGCTVNIPALSGRVLYYQVERKNGSTVTTYSIEARPIP